MNNPELSILRYNAAHISLSSDV